MSLGTGCCLPWECGLQGACSLWGSQSSPGAQAFWKALHISGSWHVRATRPRDRCVGWRSRPDGQRAAPASGMPVELMNGERPGLRGSGGISPGVWVDRWSLLPCGERRVGRRAGSPAVVGYGGPRGGIGLVTPGRESHPKGEGIRGSNKRIPENCRDGS